MKINKPIWVEKFGLKSEAIEGKSPGSYEKPIPTGYKNNKGTTLLEVLIALVLFTFIAASLMRMTDTTLKYKKKITRNIQDMKSNRNIFQVIRTDIRNIFYATDINAITHIAFIKQTQEDPDFNNNKLAKQNNLSKKQKEQLQTEWTDFEERLITPYLSRSILFAGGFKGTENSLHISAFSKLYNHEDSKASDQNIITYYIKSCKSRASNKEQSNCLWRRSSSLTNQNTEIGNELVLLEKVKNFELLYYSMSTNEWLKSWKTGPNEKNTLPAAIHIQVEFENTKKQTVKNEFKIPLHRQFVLPVQRSN